MSEPIEISETGEYYPDDDIRLRVMNTLRARAKAAEAIVEALKHWSGDWWHYTNADYKAGFTDAQGEVRKIIEEGENPTKK